ncbi:MAG: FAD:protein FMN transferase [Pseudomonadota bacterium]
MKRRRFLTVAAGFAAFPAFAKAPLRWRGVALGAEARLELAAPEAVARPALAAALAAVREVEHVFSLYDDTSFVSRLNLDGRQDDAPDMYWAMHAVVTDLHRRTGGLFDPTVQGPWRALARDDLRGEWGFVGWDHVQRSGRSGVRLGRHQQVTFNGIAQGFATDRVVEVLQSHGLRDAFVDIGEQSARGSPRLLGVADPDHGIVGQVTLRDGAIATSSPGATPLAAHGHILHPSSPRAAQWSTVSVEADRAVVADGLSTALVHADLPMIRRIRRRGDVRRILLVDQDGNVRTV